MLKQRVVVGLSGGVDSAVSAHLLKQQGHEVVAIFMKNWEDDDDSEFCSSRQDFLDAASMVDVTMVESVLDQAFALAPFGIVFGVACVQADLGLPEADLETQVADGRGLGLGRRGGCLAVPSPRFSAHRHRAKQAI